MMRQVGGKADCPATKKDEYLRRTKVSPAKEDRVPTVDLRNCDCLEVMATLKDKEKMVTLTSPPFKPEDVPGDYWTTYDRWIREIIRCSEVALVIQSATTMIEHVRRYPPKRVLIWGKSGWMKFAWRYNVIYVYSDLPVNKYIWTDLIGVPCLENPSERYNKYQDPLQLYQLLLGMFQHYDRVCDPFTGSGTSGLAARYFRMDFLGAEIDPERYKTACQRLEYEPNARAAIPLRA
jgi:site-specific DNA-methyltransferase (adenine-specific)